MFAVEFQTKIDDGNISIPEKYRRKLQGKVRVIVLAEDSDEDINFIDYLLANPIHDPNFVPLTRDEIYDRT
jgi:DNA-binding transcriptional regulator/RsmH inhibitor MraZ